MILNLLLINEKRGGLTVDTYNSMGVTVLKLSDKPGFLPFKRYVS
jgi:hypothetical protein